MLNTNLACILFFFFFVHPLCSCINSQVKHDFGEMLPRMASLFYLMWQMEVNFDEKGWVAHPQFAEELSPLIGGALTLPAHFSFGDFPYLFFPYSPLRSTTQRCNVKCEEGKRVTPSSTSLLRRDSAG